MNDRYVSSEWNQWLVPAPMQIIDRPPLTSALRANPRATFTSSRRSTPVMASCHAGVYGTVAWS
jgi:hypothetical protein